MRTSRTTSLHEPSGSERIPEPTLAYFRTRNKHRLYSLVIREFKRSGISQADLARRLGKGTDVVCRWLRSPGNWTADTISDLLFGISGSEATYDRRYPLSRIATTSVADGKAVGAIWAQTATSEVETTSGETTLSDLETEVSETEDTIVVAYLKAA